MNKKLLIFLIFFCLILHQSIVCFGEELSDSLDSGSEISDGEVWYSDDFESDLNGWGSNNKNLLTLSKENGMVKYDSFALTSSNDSGMMNKNVSFDAQQYYKMEFKIKLNNVSSSSTGSKPYMTFYYTAIDANGNSQGASTAYSYSLKYDVVLNETGTYDADWAVYSVDLSNLPGWSTAKEITRIQLAAIKNSTGIAYIDYVRFLSLPQISKLEFNGGVYCDTTNVPTDVKSIEAYLSRPILSADNKSIKILSDDGIEIPIGSAKYDVASNKITAILLEKMQSMTNYNFIVTKDAFANSSQHLYSSIQKTFTTEASEFEVADVEHTSSSATIRLFNNSTENREVMAIATLWNDDKYVGKKVKTVMVNSQSDKVLTLDYSNFSADSAEIAVWDYVNEIPYLLGHNIFKYFDERVDTIGQNDCSGDFTFFDNRYCYTSGNPHYLRYTSVPKTNEIVATRLKDYQSPERTDYLYLNRTDLTNDCFFNIDTSVASFTHDEEKTYQYYKFEGDFKSDKIGSRIELPMIRDTKSNSAPATAYPCIIQSNGSMLFADGTKAVNVFRDGEWVHYLLFINLADHAADVYVDGEKVASNIAINPDIKQINLVRVSLGLGSLNDLYIDNFDFTGLENPIVDGMEIKTSIFPEETAVKNFLNDKVAMHVYGNTIYKNGEKSQMSINGIYDKETEQYYVSSSALSQAFNMNLTDSNGEIIGDVSVCRNGLVTLSDKSTVQLEYIPIIKDGNMFVPVRQFATDVVGKYCWFFKTGILLFSDVKTKLDTSEWKYQTERINEQTTVWNDIDHLNNYLQYIRPDAKKMKDDYIATTGDIEITQHPRLLLNNNDFEIIRRHYESQDDELYNSILSGVMENADRYLELDSILYTWDDDTSMLNETSDNLLKRFFYMGYAYNVTGEQKYVDKAFEQFQIVETYPDFNTSHIIDAGVNCLALAVGFDWFYNGFTTEQRELARQIVHDRALKALASGMYGRLSSASEGTNEWTAFKTMSNDNAIINGGVISAALATLEYDDDETIQYISDSIRSVEYALQMFTPNGEFDDSYDHGDYAIRYIVLIANTLKKSFGQSYNLMGGQGMDNSLVRKYNEEFADMVFNVR